MFKRISLFWKVILVLVGSYLLLRFAVPVISMWITGASVPLPVPVALMIIYMALVLTGIVVFLAADEERLMEFWEPIESLLRGREDVRPRDDRLYNVGRWIVLIAVPLAAGWVVYSSTAPSTAAPPALRIQHPTIPFAYQDLNNPFRNPDGTVDREIIDEGRVMFQKNCRPCHGSSANGDGPMAYGFRLKPANFRSEDTIATVIEAYAFWRIKEGGLGLPTVGSPWDSAMPAWEDELTDDDIWKIIAAEYDTAGVEPRRPEAAPGE